MSPVEIATVGVYYVTDPQIAGRIVAWWTPGHGDPLAFLAAVGLGLDFEPSEVYPVWACFKANGRPILSGAPFEGAVPILYLEV